MRRTWLQRVIFVGGWTVSVLCCVLTGLAAYTVGYFDGSADSRPRLVPITATDVVRTVGVSMGAACRPVDDAPVPLEEVYHNR